MVETWKEQEDWEKWKESVQGKFRRLIEGARREEIKKGREGAFGWELGG